MEMSRQAASFVISPDDGYARGRSKIFLNAHLCALPRARITRCITVRFICGLFRTRGGTRGGGLLAHISAAAVSTPLCVLHAGASSRALIAISLAVATAAARRAAHQERCALGARDACVVENGRQKAVGAAWFLGSMSGTA